MTIGYTRLSYSHVQESAPSTYTITSYADQFCGLSKFIIVLDEKHIFHLEISLFLNIKIADKKS